ncbi:MAG TPA: TetR/AcrR family transcriptional regulator [Kiloniellaceae bacterium]|nr:TetR/AcrR family transcriptional regulator [Kiloniellaceae bacterium]
MVLPGKQFDSDAALGKAMETFWVRGYEATSVQDLVDSMGIDRGSLYATFGDKRQVFVAALRRYDDHYRKAWVNGLASTMAPRAVILSVFEDGIAAALGAKAREGCLLVNAALELSPQDPEVGHIVSSAFVEMERFFQAMIEAAQAEGAVPRRIVATEAAAGLLSLFLGLRVLARASPKPEMLQAIRKQAELLIT